MSNQPQEMEAISQEVLQATCKKIVKWFVLELAIYR